MRIINRFPLPAAMAWLVGAVLFVPIAWMVLTAIRPEHELYQVPLRILPGALDMANIQSAWYEKSFGQFFFNSAVNSVLSVLFSMPIGILAGYAFSRFEIRHSKYYRAYVLFAYMVPIIILVVPFYLIAVWLNIYNTRMGHVLGLSTYAIPFATWVMIGYFEQLPKEVEHSAAIDGADRMKTLIYILAPMIKPGVVATALLTFILAWDDYIFALILLDSETLRTLPLAIGYLSSDYELTDGLMMAMGTITTLPILLLFVFFQKYFVGGMTSGAVKG
ncbi:ABC transporter inner membrane protein [Bordetella pertussis]|nr:MULTISPECIES: carbohydrate ABC transporter permease [Bordetella]ETH39792.1 ABC transporter, permease protein [Bordetella pertussis H918]ETH46114.1 ABC transporter, permease protein [Bordetella pertussis H921]ETH83143.1 ABC transporter, permease protein [Bordetella pertussis STO1-CHOC-0017]KAK62809.1 ABC transporter, permease protein [Bordetella bronchiseptica 980-2]KCV23489.1 ABC transporter, permease protein [Bordetella pertussis H934]KCV32478.1 ABC transporter, permease protein [Bordetel